MLGLTALAAIGVLAGCAGPSSSGQEPSTPARMPAFAPDEVESLRALWIGSLPSPPADPSNRFADDPAAAILGEAIFFDQRFSATGEVSCATCHRPELAFTDGRARGEGIGETPRATMTVLGAAYSPWLFWDGRKDSLWAQALAPLENAAEHGGTRGQYAHLVAAHYRPEYEAAFGPLPDLADEDRFPAVAGPVADSVARQTWEAMAPADRDAVTAVYANIGKAIAAFERGLVPGPSRFDLFVEALIADDDAGMAVLTDDEIAGLRLFIGAAAGCTNCHSGPLFTNQSFHNTGVPSVPGVDPDPGRSAGIGLVQLDEFNCLSQWSDADPEECVALRFLRDDAEALAGAFKPPSLRNVSLTGPYMHAGQIATLGEVLRHYRAAPPAGTGHSELQALELTDAQLNQLEAFLLSLTTPRPTHEPPRKETHVQAGSHRTPRGRPHRRLQRRGRADLDVRPVRRSVAGDVVRRLGRTIRGNARAERPGGRVLRARAVRRVMEQRAPHAANQRDPRVGPPHRDARRRAGRRSQRQPEWRYAGPRPRDANPTTGDR